MTQRTVIKLGGATLYKPGGFQSELKLILEHYRNDQVYLIVGGGELVESMRTAHRLYPALNIEEMHWRCVELLDHSWSIANEVFPVDEAINDESDLLRFENEVAKARTCWVRVRAFYSKIRSNRIPNSWLPKTDWNTTSDAIAWLLGRIVRADRVVLVKQCPCNPAWSIDEAAKRGVVDSEIARLARNNPDTVPVIELQSTV